MTLVMLTDTSAPPARDNVTPAGTGWQHTMAVCAKSLRLSFPGERTPAAGLAIIPAVNASKSLYTGEWSVVHTGSGMRVGHTALPLVYAREAAALMADTGVDWTVPAEELRAPGQGIGAAVWNIYTRVEEAWDRGAPTWFARHSWQHTRPAWEVIPARWEDSHYRLDTWQALVAWLTAHQDHPGYEVETITREPSGTWRLTCAAPLCINHPETFTQPAVFSLDSEDGGMFEVRYPDRGDVAREALTAQWTRHDLQHWTCPGCSTEHIANTGSDQGC